MKKIYSLAILAACAMMVFSCKNEGKGSKEIKDAAQDAVEAVQEAAQEGIDVVSDAVEEVGKAASDDALNLTQRIIHRISVDKQFVSRPLQGTVIAKIHSQKSYVFRLIGPVIFDEQLKGIFYVKVNRGAVAQAYHKPRQSLPGLFRKASVTACTRMQNSQTVGIHDKSG